MSNDNLYRGIKRSQPSFITPRGTISSAMFKDEKGVSVDRQMGRHEEEAVQQMKDFFSNRLKGIASLPEDSIIRALAVLIPAPTENNPYHAEIYRNVHKEMLSKIQQLQLADSCTLIYLDENVRWTM